MAKNFLLVVDDTLTRMSQTQKEEVYLYNSIKDGIVISYDRRYTPFLGYTKGKNKSQRQFPKMPIQDPVLANIKRHLLLGRKKGPPGGRVFISNEMVITCPKDEHIILCYWKWPGSDIVEHCQHLLEMAKMKG